METMWKVLRRKLVGLSVLVAFIALMVPMAVALAGSDETKIEFSGERIFSPFVGDTLEFTVDNAGPGLSGLSGSGEFFDASTGVTQPFVITDSSIESIPTPVGGFTDAIVLKDGLGRRVITIELNAARTLGPPNGVRIRYFDPTAIPRFKGVFDTRFNLFDLELEIKAQ